MTGARRVRYWFPRVSGILAIVFIASFGLDALSSGAPLAQTLLGFTIHSIPCFVLGLLLVASWRWPRAGGALFIAVSLLPFVLLNNACWVNAVLAAPFFVTGLAFLASPRR